MSAYKVGVITGANKGIGYGIALRIARLYPTSFLAQASPLPLKLYITARDKGRGEAALAQLKEELSREGSGLLAEHGGPTTLLFHQLDVGDASSRSSLKATIEKDGGLDLLINNAGVALEGFDAQVVRDTFKTNYHAVRDLTNDLHPLLRANARVVNLASMLGHLDGFSEQVARRFREAQTVEESDALMEEYVKVVESGKWKEEGWRGTAYGTSKSGLIALTRAQAGDFKKAGKGVTINACCPGYVNTDMSKHRGHLTLDEGATTPVKLALDDVGFVSGTFWQKEKEVEW